MNFSFVWSVREKCYEDFSLMRIGLQQGKLATIGIEFW